MGKHKKKEKKHYKKKVQVDLKKQAPLVLKEEKSKVKFSSKKDNDKDLGNLMEEDDIKIVGEISKDFSTRKMKKLKVKIEKIDDQDNDHTAAGSSFSNKDCQPSTSKYPSSSSSSSSISSSSSETSSSSSESSASSSTISNSSSEKKKRKKKGKRSKGSKSNKKFKKSKKAIEDAKAPNNLYGQYNKVAGQQISKKGKQALKETTSGFKPYPKSNDLTKKKDEAICGKTRRTFFCLPHAITDSVPPFREWTRLIAYGVGQKSIQVNRDASSEELVRTLNKEFPALNGIPFSYAKARNGNFSENDLIDNSANMNTLSAIGATGDIFIIPHRDLLLPAEPVEIKTVKCYDCGETILACDSREHAASHLREDAAFHPGGAKKNYTRIRGEKEKDAQLDEIKDPDGGKDLEDVLVDKNDE